MTAMQPFLYLRGEEVRRALPMPEAITAMREAFVQLTRGEAMVPPRQQTELPEKDAVWLLMPALSQAHGALSLKCVTVVPTNPARGLPLIQALVILTDATTGTPLAIMDGAAVTALRTGAASGAATEALARPDARVVAVFGAGIQARTQLEAVCAVRSVREARVVDPDESKADCFAREMTAQLGLPVKAARDSKEALTDADIVCTVTTAAEPVFADAELKPGTHLNAVGIFKPQQAEIPPETVIRARVVVDQTEAALAEAGDLLRPLAAGLIGKDHFNTELGAVLAGDAPGRQHREEITLFKSVGVAVQDLCAAWRVLENARQRGLGTPLPR